MEQFEIGDPPGDLTEEEKRWWEILGSAVNSSPTGVTVGDLPVFRNLVVMQALFEHARSDTAVDANGRPIVSLSAIGNLARTVAGMLAKFRLDPASRGAVTVAAPEPVPDARDPDAFEPIGRPANSVEDVQ